MCCTRDPVDSIRPQACQEQTRSICTRYVNCDELKQLIQPGMTCRGVAIVGMVCCAWRRLPHRHLRPLEDLLLPHAQAFQGPGS
jgi:hypothetical protein